MSTNSPHDNSFEKKVFDEDVSEGNDKPPSLEIKKEGSHDSKEEQKHEKTHASQLKKNSEDSNSNSKKKKKKSSDSDSNSKKKHRRRSKSKAKDRASKLISDEFEGEFLGQCSEKDWEGAEAAYNPTLINLKKKQNRVTVFGATKKVDNNINYLGNIIKEPSQELVPGTSPRPATPPKPDDHADMIGKLVAGIVRKYLEGKANDDVQVEIKLTCGDGTVTTVLQ